MQQVKATNTSGGSVYRINQSLLFSPENYPTQLFRNWGGTSGNTRTWTLSFWMKGLQKRRQHIFDVYDTSEDRFFCGLDDTGKFWAYTKKGDEVRLSQRTTAVFLDPSAWYHVVLRIDTHDVEIERAQVYVNGEWMQWQAGGIMPEQGKPFVVNQAGLTHRFGILGSASSTVAQAVYGYLSEVYFIDGYDLPSSHFAAIDSNGVYNPIPFTGEYGGKGFYLPFAASNIGGDDSGNQSNFSTENFTSANVVVDTPTNNYCTLNPLDPSGSTYIYGNTVTSGNTITTFDGIDGKWYYEKDGSGVTVDGAVGTVGSGAYNFGQAAWKEVPPVGYKPLCTNNLSPTEDTSDTSYVGNGSDNGTFVSMGGAVESLRINGTEYTAPSYNPLDASKTWVSNGLKSTSSVNNANGTTYNITDVVLKKSFKYARGQ